MVEYIPCYPAPALRWGLLPATRLASRKILTEQNIYKKSGQDQHSVYSVDPTGGLQVLKQGVRQREVRSTRELVRTDIGRAWLMAH